MSAADQNGPIAQRQDTLLLLLRAAGTSAMDPIRIMKGVFIINQEAPPEWLAPTAQYQFVPEKYGPCSYDVYSDLDALVDQGLVQTTQAPGRSWHYYSVTPAGQERAERLRQRTAPDAMSFVISVAGFVRALPFAKLLKTIYARYPEYAVNSVFQY